MDLFLLLIATEALLRHVSRVAASKAFTSLLVCSASDGAQLELRAIGVGEMAMHNLMSCAHGLSSHRSEEGGSVVDTDLLRLAASVAASAAKSCPVLGVGRSTFCFRALHNFFSVSAAREFSPSGSSQQGSLGVCLTFFTWTRMMPLLSGSWIPSAGACGPRTIEGSPAQEKIIDLGGKGTMFYNMFRCVCVCVCVCGGVDDEEGIHRPREAKS